MTDSATLTVTNANPVVHITAPTTGSSIGANVQLGASASFTDAGANDTQTCSIAWGDATTSVGAIAAGVCTGSHNVPPQTRAREPSPSP